MNIFKEVADIKTADTLDLPRPKANFHTVVAKPTDIQKEMVQELSERAKAVHDRKVKPETDNMRELHVTATNHEENVTKAVAA